MKPITEFIDKIICGDALQTLKTLPNESIDMSITSPPYWGLRDYGVEGQIGLEPNFNEFLKKMWDIYDEIKRVLKPDGTIWINFGDTYAGSGMGTWDVPEGYKSKQVYFMPKGKAVASKINYPSKCLCLIPERFALGMVERGWILRNKIIWHKPNHMPSSVKDRFSNSWEYIYFFSKSRKYYFDLDAIREPHKWADKDKRFEQRRVQTKDRTSKSADGTYAIDGVGYNPSGKNPGDVVKVQVEKRQGRSWAGIIHKDATYKDNPDFWTITTHPFSDAHFAVFPEKLVEIPIKTTPRWICNKCGKPRVRIVKINRPDDYNPSVVDDKYQEHCRKGSGGKGTNRPLSKIFQDSLKTTRNTIGWTKCDCNAGFHSAVILDPFVGAGTTAVVAKKLGRHSIGIDISKEYCEMAVKRIKNIPFEKFMKRKPKPPKGTKRLDKFIKE